MQDVKLSDAAFETIVRLFGARTGLTFREDQRESIRQGIQRAMDRSNVADPAEFARLLQFDVDALDNVVVELTVGETYFFREPNQFDYIRSHVVPEILKRNGPDHRVRIWSAACASGEEPYSLAMLCYQEGLAGQCSILATDISSEALDKAKNGSYGDWSLRARHCSNAEAYLDRVGQRYEVKKQIRRMVHFEFLNLALDVYPSFETGTKSLDLILCRNVLIYFDVDTIRAVATRLFDALAPGGWLITASGDPPLGSYANFETVVTDFGIFYRRPALDAVDDWLPESTASDDAAETGIVEAPSPINFDDALLIPPATAGPAINEALRDAEQALSRGEYERAAELAEARVDDPAACVVYLQALANINTDRAVRSCQELAQRHSLSPELHYLHAVLLLELNLDVEAIQAVQRAIYLDRSLAIAHFLLGSILQRRGALEGAQRAFRNARNLARDLPANEPVALAENETAGQLAQAAQTQLTAIEAAM